MPRYVKGNHTVETSVPREGVALKAQGYKEQKARTKRVREADKAAEDAVTPLTVFDPNND